MPSFNEFAVGAARVPSPLRFRGRPTPPRPVDVEDAAGGRAGRPPLAPDETPVDGRKFALKMDGNGELAGGDADGFA